MAAACPSANGPSQSFASSSGSQCSHAADSLPNGLEALDLSETTNAEEEDISSPFEGPEKLLEIWWQDCAESVANGRGLRRIRRTDWEDMLDLVHCKVISVIQNDSMDAYMLSESSMFVWPHKLILKTCGTTTLLLGLERIMELARSVGFKKGAWRTFYSRKTFMWPERQLGPHRDWKDEMDVLDQFFTGRGYSVGPSNGDHWLLYISDQNNDVLGHVAQPDLSGTPVDSNFQLCVPRATPSDQSLELLMSELDPDACSAFYFPDEPGSTLDGHTAGQALSKRLGITRLCDDEGRNQLDAFLFQPCGYSANLITQQDRYATIHVTPEHDWSYASFETNISFGTGTASDQRATVQEVVERVLKVFRPGRWSMTLFVSREEDEPETTGEKGWASLVKRTVTGYRRTDKISYEFEDYDLLFSSFAST